MKILQVTQFFSPVHGGSAEVPYHLSKELAKRGHEVAVYTSDFKLSQDYIDSIPEVKVRSFRTWSSWANFYVTPSMMKEAKRGIRHFDIIHMHNYRSFQNMVVAYYAKKYNVPYVLQAHGSLRTFLQKGWLKRTFDAIWGYKILKDASKVIAVTSTEAEQYRSMCVSKDKVKIVPSGINLSEFESLPQKGEFRRKYALNDDQRIILYLGRIHKTKGLDLLVKAFAELSKSLNNIKLVIVGPDDGYLSSLRRLIAELGISDKVLFTGPLYGEEKLRAYVDADVFVTPSFSGFPLTFLEACASGTPIVTTERGDNLDWIHNQVGYVVAYDKDQLADALSHMLSDDNLRRGFGEQGKLLIREQFTLTRITAQVENIYENCVSSGCCGEGIHL